MNKTKRFLQVLDWSSMFLVSFALIMVLTALYVVAKLIRLDPFHDSETTAAVWVSTVVFGGFFWMIGQWYWLVIKDALKKL